MTRREPRLHKSKRDGYFHAIFYERNRHPQRRWIALGTKTRRVAQRKIVDLADRYLRKEYDPWKDALPGSATLTQAIKVYVQARHDEGFSRKATRQRERILESFALTLAPEIDVAAVTPSHVRTFIQQEDFSDWTRRTYYARLRTFFACCKEHGLCEDNPADPVKSPPEPRGTINYVTPDGLRRILVAIEHTAETTECTGEVRWYADIVRFAAGSGLRLGEICALKWKDVDLVAGTVIVRSDDVHRAKGDKERPVQVSPQATRVLHQWHARDKPNPDAFVFHGPRSDHLSYEGTSRLFRKYRKMAGLPEGLTFHSLRKTYGTVLASAGVPLRTVQKMLGHSDISITARIYADVIDSAAREQVLQAFNGVDL